jgi:hypothetical protein
VTNCELLREAVYEFLATVTDRVFLTILDLPNLEFVIVLIFEFITQTAPNIDRVVAELAEYKQILSELSTNTNTRG